MNTISSDELPTLQLLGRFELRVGPRLFRLNAGDERVLAYLSIAAPVMRRDTLAGRIWAWSSQSRACANLRNALWRIRQADRRLLETDHDEVRLSEHLVVDLHRSSACARQLLDDRTSGDAATSAPGLLETDILPDWDDDWVQLERERHRQLRIHALEAWSASLVDSGRFAEAIDVAYAAISAEPLRESARQLLIKAHLAEGNRSEAARQYETFRCLLDAELGVPPSPTLEALVDRGAVTAGRVAVPRASR
jgi:DNA-binding SARP family transcriptional activator